MKVKITFIVLKKDNNISLHSDRHLTVYLDDSYNFPTCQISTKNEYETLKDLSDKHFDIDFEWMKKDLFDFKVLNNQECEVLYVSCIPEVFDAQKSGDFYTLPELHDMDLKLEKNHERAIFKRGKSPLGW